MPDYSASIAKMHQDAQDAANWNSASSLYDRVTQAIKRFEEGLDEEHEIARQLVSFGGNSTFHILSVGYHRPDLIFFHGQDGDGNKVELCQHISQVNILFLAVKKIHTPARRIALRQDREEVEHSG